MDRPTSNIYDLNEFLIHPNLEIESQEVEVPLTSSGVEYTYWERNVTLTLLSLYNENHKKVGVSIRSNKKLFEVIATKLNEIYGLKLTEAQVNNKFKGLDKAYKKVIDNNKKTGRGRKYFEFEKEMDDIFGKRRKINPEILLSENTIDEPSTSATAPNLPASSTPATTFNLPTSAVTSNTSAENNKENVQPRRKQKKTRSDVLELIRQDRLKYQKEKLLLMHKKLEQQTRRNDLAEEKNNLLKEFLSKNTQE